MKLIEEFQYNKEQTANVEKNIQRNIDGWNKGEVCWLPKTDNIYNALDKQVLDYFSTKEYLRYTTNTETFGSPGNRSIAIYYDALRQFNEESFKLENKINTSWCFGKLNNIHLHEIFRHICLFHIERIRNLESAAEYVIYKLD